MAKFGPEEAVKPAVETAEKPQEAKAESGKEKPLSEVGRERAERAQQTVSKGVEAVKGAFGKGLSFLKEKGMALLALDVAAARAGKATGEFLKKDAAKTLEHAKIVGQFVKEQAKEAAVDIVLGPAANLARQAAKEAGRDDVLKFTAEKTGEFLKKDAAKTLEDVKAVGRFGAAVGKGAVEAGKTAVEVGAIAGAVGAEVGKFAARKAGEGMEAAAGFAAKKIEQTMDSAQKKYEALATSLTRLEQQARNSIAEARDRFNGKMNTTRENAINAIADAINAGIDAKQNLQSSIDQGRKAVGVSIFEFIKGNNERKLEELKTKLERTQKKVSHSTAMISALSR